MEETIRKTLTSDLPVEAQIPSSDCNLLINAHMVILKIPNGRLAMKVFTPAEKLPSPPRLWQAAGLESAEGIAVVSQIENGLSGSVASLVMEWADITQSEFKRITGIPATTFSRSIKHGFTPEQSEKIVRFIRVLDRAVELFEGDKAAARRWLNEPVRALDWKTPAELMASEAGAYEVMKLITRLEHGVYS